MKNLRFIFFLVSSVLFSQIQEATLHFNDGGESIKGYADIVEEYKIKFKLEPEGEVSIWTGDIVKGITFHEFERDIDFEYTFTKNFKRTPQLMQVLVFGEVKLYSNPKTITYSDSYLYGDNYVHHSYGGEYKKNRYFVKRDSEPYAIRLKGNFKKRIKDYFGNCIGIQKRIKSNEFRWATLPDLVSYYNNYCIDF